jgi:hypothetical protein
MMPCVSSILAHEITVTEVTETWIEIEFDNPNDRTARLIPATSVHLGTQPLQRKSCSSK